MTVYRLLSDGLDTRSSKPIAEQAVPRDAHAPSPAACSLQLSLVGASQWWEQNLEWSKRVGGAPPVGTGYAPGVEVD